MINAFRHQRFLHLGGQKPSAETKTEVINAFRHQRFLHFPRKQLCTRLRQWCDQRLSASKIFAPDAVSLDRHCYRVINAFRHQRFLHTLFIKACMKHWVEVINAFRHQRFLHSARSASKTACARGDQRLSASKIFAPICADAGGWGEKVINAFRHQRFLHFLFRCELAAALEP